MDLKTEFRERCIETEVPGAVFNAAWHQVSQQNLTMIVFKKDTGDIHMWFKEVPMVSDIRGDIEFMRNYWKLKGE